MAFDRQRALGAAFCVAAVLAVPGTALADCAEPPLPGVDWRKCTMHSREFINADLTGAKLKDGRFTRADFSGSTLVGIDGRRAKFIDAVAHKANFEGARLSGADFTNANLIEANLTGADLYRAQLQGAVMRGADLTGAKLDHADFAGTDLSGARWTDGKTVCAEGSIGQCRLSPSPERVSG